MFGFIAVCYFEVNYRSSRKSSAILKITLSMSLFLLFEISGIGCLKLRLNMRLNVVLSLSKEVMNFNAKVLLQLAQVYLKPCEISGMKLLMRLTAKSRELF